MSSYPNHEVVGMPALSPTMEVGTLAKWSVQPGQAFSAGDVLAEVETDKASIDFVTEDDGFCALLLVPEGSEVSVGSPIMVTVEEEDDVKAMEGFEPEGGASSEPETTAAATTTTTTSTPPPPPPPP
eukprot:CAMPEP_0182484350 /NCGR_PEP_ID=MMETSP1319-20130603/43265_1 /TAXON_ID=172717 /ORGANISM="Bolidomonas pacifica, Strain RCC208" /LENGTH=126 /DNA_ID=CAMNT_0024686245 /DNA_START=187 /DNA_END=563 /DNA_ORIENTATION=+